jgi:DNA-directed RNA polymerase specialized sigma24 family protein
VSNSFYDLNIAFEGDEPDPAKLPVAVVRGAIDGMPTEIGKVATASLIEKRSIAEVAAEFGITEGEVVSRLQQAQLVLGMFLFQQHGGRH